MVPRFRTFRHPALPAMLALALVGAGCAQVANAGLGLLGIHRDAPENTKAPAPASQPSGTEPSSGTSASSGPSVPRTTSIYEVMPATDWGRYAVGDPASPAFAFSRTVSASSCVARPWGISRVLPLDIGMGSLNGLSTYMDTADPATRGEDVFSGGVGMARWSMSRTARESTYTRECSQNLFAYVRLGGNGVWEPVVVR